MLQVDRPLTVLLQLCLYTGWFSPQRFPGLSWKWWVTNLVSTREIPWREEWCFTNCGELLPCQASGQKFLTTRELFSWGLLPPIAGALYPSLWNSNTTTQARRVFSTTIVLNSVTTQLFTMICSLLTFVHTAAELGSNPAIQQFQMLMVQTT